MYRMTLSLFESCVFLLGVKVGEEGESARMANSFHTGFNRDSFLFFFSFHLSVGDTIMDDAHATNRGRGTTRYFMEGRESEAGKAVGK